MKVIFIKETIPSVAGILLKVLVLGTGPKADYVPVVQSTNESSINDRRGVHLTVS